jgi:hypothetical protein
VCGEGLGAARTQEICAGAGFGPLANPGKWVVRPGMAVTVAA